MGTLDYLLHIAERCRQCAADLRVAGACEEAIAEMLRLAVRFDVHAAAFAGLCAPPTAAYGTESFDFALGELAT